MEDVVGTLWSGRWMMFDESVTCDTFPPQPLLRSDAEH
jgi:hypothetical protein